MSRAATVAAALLVGACGSQAAPGTGGPSQLQAQVVASEVVAGPQQRVPIGILDHNTPINDASVHVRAFLLQGSTAVFKGESDAPFKGAGLEGAGVYVAHLDLNPAGNWGLDLTASQPNGARLSQRLAFTVTATPIVPM